MSEPDTRDVYKDCFSRILNCIDLSIPAIWNVFITIMSILNSGVWLLKSSGEFVAKEAPFSRAGGDEIVIQNKAVAINLSQSFQVLCV